MARLSGCLSRAAACCCLQTSRAAWRCAWSSSATSICLQLVGDGIVDVCRLLFGVCVPCGRQQSSWCVEERYRPASAHCLSSLVWGSPRWFDSSRVEPGSAWARVQTLPTQGRRIRQLSSRGRDSWVWVSMPCTPTSSSRVYGWCYFSRSPSSLSSRCAFYSTEFGQGGRPGTRVLLCLRVWYRSTLHSVLVWLLGSLGGKHTPVSLKGSHAVG